MDSLFNIKMTMLAFLLSFFIHAMKQKNKSSFYVSFEGCEIGRCCKYQSELSKIKAYSKGVEEPCEKEDKFDNDFLICEDYFFSCGYVDLDDEGKVSEISGVKIGIGVDLSELTEEILIQIGVNENIVRSMKPFLGPKGKNALTRLLESHLTLTEEEAIEFSKKVHGFYYDALVEKYKNNSKLFNCPDCEKDFQNLSKSIRTALFSFYFSTLSIGIKDNDIWSLIQSNNWKLAANAIESFPHDPHRRKLEGNLIRATFKHCHRPIYTSIVIDESDGIDDTSFDQAKKFVYNYIKYTSNSTYVSLITFADKSLILSPFSNDKPTLSRKIIKHIQRGGRSYTGSAIKKSLEEFKSFSFPMAGVAKVMIVLSNGITDGGLSPIKIARHARTEGIYIISIGFGEEIHNDELVGIAGGIEDVANITDYFGLNCHNISLMNKICSLITTIPNGERIETKAEDIETPLHFEVEKKRNVNERITLSLKNVKNNNYDPKLKIFLSYSYPFPDENIHEMAHYGQTGGDHKILVIGPNTKNENISNNKDKENEILYISIYGDDVLFDLQLEECKPTECRVGTNEHLGENLHWLILLIIGIVGVFLTGGLIWYFKYLKKKVDGNGINVKDERLKAGLFPSNH